MRAWHIIARLSRPALAVAALYAFVLGSFLGALTANPVAGAAAAHVLCTPSADAENSWPVVPDAGHRACCTAACLGGLAFVPPASAAARSPERARVPAGWVWRTASPLAAGPPGDPRVRGPPSV